MKLMLDLNILLDVFQKRVPHYQFSSQVIKEVLKHTVNGILPAHGVTTIHYILTKYADSAQADKEIDWLLLRFEIAACEKATFFHARSLSIPDFEDAVVAALAELNGCDYIITRNEEDFASSPIPAMAPQDFIKKHTLNP